MARSLITSDKETVAEEFLKLLLDDPKVDSSLKNHLNQNYDQIINDLILVLDTKFPDLTVQSLSNKEDLKQLTMAFSTTLILNQPDPGTKKTLLDGLKDIYKEFGLMNEDGKLNPDKKLTPDERKQLETKLEAWAEKILGKLQENKLLPSPRPGMENALAEKMADAMMKRIDEGLDKVDQGLINLFGMDPNDPGSVAFPIPTLLGNGLAFIDQNPNNGDAQIDRINDAYDSQYTGGDYVGTNAATQQNYAAQGDTLADVVLGQQEANAAPQAQSSAVDNLADQFLDVLTTCSLAETLNHSMKPTPPGRGHT